MYDPGRRRVDTGATLAPVARLAGFEKSEDGKVALRDRRHGYRCPQRPDHCHGGHQQTPPPRSSESLIPVLHSHPQPELSWLRRTPRLIAYQASVRHSFPRSSKKNLRTRLSYHSLTCLVKTG